MTNVEELARLVASGQSLDQIRRGLLPESWRRALRACAAADAFSYDLFAAVLGSHAGTHAPELAELAERGLVEPIDGADGGWRVPRADAAGWMLEWQTGWSGDGAPPDLVELEAELASWHAERGNPTARARHLLLADPAEAIPLFDGLFREADEARDFARYQDLLDLLADPHRVTFAGPEVSELRLDRTGHLRARLYWSTDYGRSAQFLQPPGLRERTDRLLSASGPRVWQLFAPSGHGKTMQLQWLVARHCVPLGIPCARIDFDVVDPVNVARYPWLMLLEVAEQLDRRWPRRVFEKLDRFASYRSLAGRQTSALSRGAARGVALTDVDEVERAIIDVFVRRFNAAAGDRPVLLVVDTLEEVLLTGTAPLGLLLGLLAHLVRECPALRLVLAGRYDLHVRVPGRMAEFGSAEPVELAGFAPDQATIYLRDIRGIPDPALRAVVARKTDGYPLLVALFADLVEDDPEITSAVLEQYREPALLLLIDRVIRRIRDPQVQWLVRYGVVPRRLTFDDVTTLLGPFLERGVVGPSDQDDPRADAHHRAGNADVFPFTEAPDGPTLAATWDRLLAYSARASWVSQPPGDVRTVVFHQIVRAPMRRLISGWPVFLALHEAFRRRFDELARMGPSGRAGYLREAVYHRFQMADPDAADHWRAAVRRLRDDGDLDGMQAVARDVLSDDYRDIDDQPVVPAEVIAEAHGWLGYAAVELARELSAEASDPLWAEADQSLAHREAALRGTADPVSSELAVAAAVAVVVGAALLIRKGKLAAAAELVQGALPHAPASERPDLLRALGDAQAAAGSPAADATYRDALDQAGAQGRADQRSAILLSLARLSESNGRLDLATQWCGLAPATSAAARLMHARLLLACYRPAAAIGVLADLDRAGPADLAAAARMRARAHLQQGRSGSALAELAAAAAAAADLTDPSARSTQLAETHQLRGVVLAELLDVEEAEASFVTASSLWSELGFAAGHPECAFLYYRFLVRTVGDVTAAARVARPPASRLSELEPLWSDLTVELLAAQGGSTEEDSAGTEVGPLLAPRARAQAVAARLARSWSRHRRLLPGLLDAVARLQPPSARLVVLDELRRGDDVIPAGDVTALRTLYDPIYAPDLGVGDSDAAVQRQLLSELDRLGGNHRRAIRALDDALADLPAGPEALLARRRWLRARVRLPGTIAAELLDPLLDPDLAPPLLRAETLLALARATFFAVGSPRELLATARDACRAVGRPTRCAADVLRAEAELTGHPSTLALADDMDARLGIRRPERPRSAAGRVLADRAGERSVVLRRPDAAPSDLVMLQYMLVNEWPQLAADLGDVLFDGANRDLARGNGLDALRLETDDVALQGLPWELAVAPQIVAPPLSDQWRRASFRSLPASAERLDVAWIQRGLNEIGVALPIDGVLGAATARGLRELAPDADVTPLSPRVRETLANVLGEPRSRPAMVVVVRPNALVESMVASHADSGFDVTHLYARHGFRARVIDRVDDADTDWLAILETASVLHITARLDMRSAGPYFDMSSAAVSERLRSKARPVDIRPADVARWLRGCMPGRIPLVVLDPPSPGSPFDVPWQLVLRNQFAATLFAYGVPAIIATGLQMSGAPYIDAIAAGTANGWPLARIATAMRPPETFDDRRRLARGDWATDADQLAGRAVAVFAAPSAFTLPGR
ncbi:hypothetical protein [Pseudonocardia broussonetiae]|uniref:AAA ATPase-like protein n=1 Tax=Pseudonocardia broussonetiae TaxID=2736640 RepID=A0A6M6JIP5_9PSEU|nr:hypothetical protein [Pseudonocardia broussonetiae]QJY47944.1 hypothetical protein HOP40_20860 [Pseudonocardia broussonetiae]